jgi:hypothetical protein
MYQTTSAIDIEAVLTDTALQALPQHVTQGEKQIDMVLYLQMRAAQPGMHTCNVTPLCVALAVLLLLHVCFCAAQSRRRH